MIEFKPWPKTPRLFRDIVITEKIDGTNACVRFDPLVGDESEGDLAGATSVFDLGRGALVVQSRTRIITPEKDNFGFAAWARDNGNELFNVLGFGTHYGEWWGSGIQRGYGLTKGEKRFSLFNTSTWSDVDLSSVPGLGVVPVMYEGPFAEEEVTRALTTLVIEGSVASPGFADPEGIVVFHTAAGRTFKVTIKGDEKGKEQ